MRLRLYLINGSHPCGTVLKALSIKDLDYKVVEWPPVLHALIQRALFGARTVPSLRIDRTEKISGSTAIMRRLDQLSPEPPLFPTDPERRAAVEDAEAWGDRVFQPVGRTLLWPAFLNNTAAMPSYTEGSKIPMPDVALRAIAPLMARIGVRVNRTGDQPARRALAELPAQLDQVDGYIAAGTIGDAEHPNAADLQIGATVRLLMTIGDVRPLIDGRPCAELALELFPSWPGHVPAGSLELS
ncbi:MAG TPA: glutathione S-transferase family protein [Solirubrobacteraceae bacterium]|jgi:glutathione S-transferase|nr:glutathione S-transferase family protein [Solirubrobacteraceae bacterium]